jgi:hypothetical protein
MTSGTQRVQTKVHNAKGIKKEATFAIVARRGANGARMANQDERLTINSQ